MHAHSVVQFTHFTVCVCVCVCVYYAQCYVKKMWYENTQRDELNSRTVQLYPKYVLLRKRNHLWQSWNLSSH